MDRSSILIVEDHALSAFAVETSLKTLDTVENIYCADCAKVAYEILDKHKIDLIILDLGLPEINGVQAAREIREKNKEVKILILTSYCDKKEVSQCLEIGICGYCTKDIKPDKLLVVIKDVLSGSMYFDSVVSGYITEITSKNNEKSSSEVFCNISVKDCYNLTTQEKRVLILLASGNNNRQIAKKLSISVNTTKVHVCSILQKMGVEDRTQAAIKAIRENLIV